MYEKLVKRLRHLAGTDNLTEFDEAADAIEERCKQADKFMEEAARLNAKLHDMVEVKHGRWIWVDDGFHCSECWHHAYGNTGEVMSGEYKYCPFCGARMYGDGDG